jgi:hypothetical protein
MRFESARRPVPPGLESPAELASPEQIYRGAVRAFSLVFIALGLVLLVVALAGGGGPLSVGVLLGLAFLAVGAGRLWIASRT